MVKISKFDPVDYLTDDESINEYLKCALEDSLEDSDINGFVKALTTVACARKKYNLAEPTLENGLFIKQNENKDYSSYFINMQQQMQSLGFRLTVERV